MAAQAFSFEQLEEPPVAPRAARARTVEEAVGEAEALLAAAEAEAARVREQARGEGYEAGRAEALDELRAHTAHAASALGEAVTGAQLARHAAADRVEAHAVDLALRLAEKIVAGAVAAQPQRIVDVVRGALRLLTDREGLVVLVNPADIDAVRDAMGDLAAQMGGFTTFDLQSDRRVHRGGAIVRTSVGEIDATLETKLERAREVLEHELAQ